MVHMKTVQTVRVTDGKRSFSFHSLRVAKAFFYVSVLYFLIRGPYRAVATVNSWDFAAVYGAARCWLHAWNPYDMLDVGAALRDAGYFSAGGTHKLMPSIYPISSFPVVALLAWLPWSKARLLWSLVSMGFFSGSLLLVFRNTHISPRAQWLLAAAILMFSPVNSGVSSGNPSVICCSLVLLAIYCVLNSRQTAGALMLGFAHCIKPQISIFAVALFFVWHAWRPLITSLIPPLAATLAGILRASSINEFWHWMATLKATAATELLSGGGADPRVSNPFSYALINAQAIFGTFTNNVGKIDIIAWGLVTGLVASYLVVRSRRSHVSRCLDMAFFSTITLIVVYHRYYDAQLLLAAVPYVVSIRKDLRAIAFACSACLSIIAFPLQALFAEYLSVPNPRDSALSFLLLRHQPLLVLLLAALFLASLILGANRQRPRPEFAKI